MSVGEKVCLLTGASEGIGRATARALAQRGASVVLAARSAGALMQLKTELEAFPGERLVVPADLGQEAERERLVERALAHFGRVDVLINNAGVGLDAPVEAHSLAEARYLFEVNFFAPLHLIQLLLPAMRRRGGGQIVQVSSIVGLRAVPHSSLYSASKYALNGLSDALRIELQRSNIAVTSIYPGVTETSFMANQLRPPPARKRRRAVPAEHVADRIVRSIERRSRAEYVSVTDRVFVGAAMALPGLAERMLGILFRRRRGITE